MFDNLKILPNGDYQLNPDAYCPLTLHNISMETISLIQRFFVENVNGRGVNENIRFLFMTQPIGIREVEAFIRGEYTCLSEAYVDMNSIISNYYKDKSGFYELCKKYSPEITDLYFQELRYIDYVRILDDQHKLKRLYDKLVQFGMAIQREKIPLHLIIASLGMEKLREIGKEFNIKGKKKNIDTAILFCENNDIVSYIKTLINIENCFMVKKIPGVETMQEMYSYAYTIADLFYSVYASYFFRYWTIVRAEEAMKHGAIEGLQYIASDRCPEESKCKNGKVFSIAEVKKIKFKLGCGCDLVPYNRKWD